MSQPELHKYSLAGSTQSLLKKYKLMKIYSLKKKRKQHNDFCECNLQHVCPCTTYVYEILILEYKVGYCTSCKTTMRIVKFSHSHEWPIFSW